MPDLRPQGADASPLTDLHPAGTGDAPVTVPRPFPPQSWRARWAGIREQLPVSPARWAASALTVVAVIGAGWWFLRPPPPVAEKSLPMASRQGTPPVGASTGAAAGPTSPSGPTSAAGAITAPVSVEITVHAAGAVVRPGVYRLPMGARVTDLLTAAGGQALDADGDRINLAAAVQDGERVYVPRRGEDSVPAAVGGSGPATGSSSGSGSGPLVPNGGGASSGGGGASGGASTGAGAGPVDLNTATAEQLDALPGVGPSTAQAILEYRRQHGRFQSIDELLDVRGIGDAKLAQLRDRVRVR